MRSKYGQNFLHQSKKYAADTVKTASKREIKKRTEVKIDSIGKRSADKITGIATNKQKFC